VTAALIGLIAISVSLTGFSITLGVWLHSANASKENLRDTLDAEQVQSQEWRAKYETELVAHGVCIRQRDTEHELRVIAEAQRNAAQSRVRDLLRSHMEKATDDEIREITERAFSAVGVVSAPVPRSEDGRDSLIDPFAT
jgi:hypothetical protein